MILLPLDIPDSTMGTLVWEDNSNVTFHDTAAPAGSLEETDGNVCQFFENYTSEEELERNTYSQGQVLFVSVCLPLIMALGVINNFAFIYVVIRVPRMRTVTNCYLVGLAVSDVLFLVFAIGSKIVCYVSSPIYGDDTPLGLSGCLLTQFIINTSYFATLCFITLVSWERYNGVCRPHRKRDTKLRIFKLLAASCLASSLMSATLSLSLAVEIVECITWPDGPPYDTWPTQRYLYYPVFDWVDKYSYGAQTIPFFISLTINVFFYQRIIKGLDKSMNRRHLHSNHRCSGGDSSTRNQIARMLVVNGITLFALLAPFEIMSLFQLIGMLRDHNFILTVEVRGPLVAVARVLSYINAVVNPVIYTALSSRYRESFKITFMPTQCRPRQRQRIENSVHGSTVTVQCGVTSKIHESRM
ncbi:thyrotropin-releasing hormone receptor-like [Acanthaster planci]|uniref:Thyrotropin-releasing hormone receptor-like n=1 Tax=Acanthaster planci TaxID=133434 RepID=A0A8B7XHQ3_ACAPL|nr:thyrotropin-releasing hormone receptor-like [Acanthaster planci]